MTPDSKPIQQAGTQTPETDEMSTRLYSGKFNMFEIADEFKARAKQLETERNELRQQLADAEACATRLKLFIAEQKTKHEAQLAAATQEAEGWKHQSKCNAQAADNWHGEVKILNEYIDAIAEALKDYESGPSLLHHNLAQTVTQLLQQYRSEQNIARHYLEEAEQAKRVCAETVGEASRQVEAADRLYRETCAERDALRAQLTEAQGQLKDATCGRCVCSGCGRTVNNAWRDSDGHHCLTCLAKQRDESLDQLSLAQAREKKLRNILEQAHIEAESEVASELLGGNEVKLREARAKETVLRGISCEFAALANATPSGAEELE